MIAPNSILNYMGNFLGYGNLKSPFWFVGMEEGGGNEIEPRFQSWEARGCHATEDLVEFHRAMGIAKWFMPPYPLQSTWRQVIRTYLNAHDLEAPAEAIRAFQKTRLGRTCISATSSPCIFELMPLPSPNLGEWPYRRFAVQHRDLAFLESRRKYQDAIVPHRIQHLRRQIKEQRPRVVCFFGLKYLDHWSQICDVELSSQRVEGREGNVLGTFYSSSNDSTLFIVTAHPSAFGGSNTYFNRVGQIIGQSLGGSNG